MCDTLVATPAITSNGSMILAKNSDREANEAQIITWVPSMDYNRGEMVECTYLKIPQVRHTFSVFLSRPFWMFGAEMGINEHGVAIGNEAVFTRVAYSKKGLTGMDLLRLALERSTTAKEGMEVIDSLLRQYGQGGNCAMEGKLYYHNSFIIADSSEAYIMETAGVHWAARRVIDGGAISNILTIDENYDFSSPGLEDFALQKGYLKKGEVLNFRKAFKDRIYSHFARGDVRRHCSISNLREKDQIGVQDMMSYLRDHNEPEPFTPGKRNMERVCMHAGGLISSQSTGSMVAELKEGAPPVVWFTGTAAPCVSFFKPWSFPMVNDIARVSLTVDNPHLGLDLYGTATNRRDGKSLWWLGEDIHRTVLPRYGELASIVQKERDVLEKEVIASVAHIQKGGDKGKLHELCQRQNEFLIEKTETMRGKIVSLVKDKEIEPSTGGGFLRRWKKYNRKAEWQMPKR